MDLVELLNQVIDNILGKRNPEEYLMYTRDAAQAVRWGDEGAGSGAFFLDTPDLRQVLKLAQEGKALPQKSTYFYPKPPSGMVFLRLNPNRRVKLRTPTQKPKIPTYRYRYPNCHPPHDTPQHLTDLP